MTTKIQAYFPNEDAAESASRKLHRFQAGQVEVGPMTGGFDPGVPLLLPLTSTADESDSSGTGFTAEGFRGAGAFLGLEAIEETGEGDPADWGAFTAVLTADVPDEQARAAVEMLRQSGGHVEALKS
ncbi:hypothetical protein [Paenibacillus sp. y28]|uniref:hypothetical protein n=1 Tax=Paenibacillus sp. y28 TaxID=3129110 RepID=UPI0030181365